MTLARVRNNVIMNPTASEAINDNAVFIATDGVDAADRGTQIAPYATFEYAQANIGGIRDRHFYFRGGTYDEAWMSGGVNGIHVTLSGVDINDQVIVEPFLTETAIYDLQGVSGTSKVGFYLNNRSWVTIRGMELTKTMGSALYTKNGTTDITFDSCYCHDIDGVTGTNVGGARLDGVTRATVINCKFHTIRVGGTTNANAAGVHGYGGEDCFIENNTIYDAYNGVFHKLSTGNIGYLIKLNLIYNVNRGVYYDVQGGGSPPHKNQRVTQNIIKDTDVALFMNAKGASGANDIWDVWNNVVDDFRIGLVMENLTNGDFWNNIFLSGANRSYQDSIIHRSTSSFASDNQLFFNAQSFEYDQFGGSSASYSTLAAWQSGQSQDANSDIGDPLFDDRANNDYHLGDGSPAIGTGKGGVDMGIYLTGNETIGADF